MTGGGGRFACGRQGGKGTAPGSRRYRRMQHKLLHTATGETGTQRTYVVVLETGEEVMASLEDFITRENIHAAQITAIGALSGVVLNYFDWERKSYQNIPVAEQVEVASLLGDVAEGPDGKPALHVHIVVGRRDGYAMAGHVGEARVRPTLEVILTESPAHLRKKIDPEAGIALIRPAA
jgi:predicted DNA-binding protein with PD1-like motif